MYTTTAKITDKLGTSLTTAQSNYFTNVLNAAIDATINRITGTAFGSTTSTSIYVDGSDSSLLIIPTMHDITAVAKLDDNTSTYIALPVADYRTYPQGDLNKYAIRNINGTWSDGLENYKITGKLGFAEIPADIIDIATTMAIDSLGGNANNYKSERVGDWAVTYADTEKTILTEAMSILESYRRLSRSI